MRRHASLAHVASNNAINSQILGHHSFASPVDFRHTSFLGAMNAPMLSLTLNKIEAKTMKTSRLPARPMCRCLVLEEIGFGA